MANPDPEPNLTAVSNPQIRVLGQARPELLPRTRFGRGAAGAANRPQHHPRTLTPLPIGSPSPPEVTAGDGHHGPSGAAAGDRVEQLRVIGGQVEWSRQACVDRRDVNPDTLATSSLATFRRREPGYRARVLTRAVRGGAVHRLLAGWRWRFAKES